MAMDIQQRMIKFVIKSNWYLFVLATLLGFINTPFKFALGILCGGILVTLNFHLLRHTLNKAFDPEKRRINVDSEKVRNNPENMQRHGYEGHSILNVVLIKYYIRFAISGIVIFALISKNIVEPIGLIFGLSVVVASIVAATVLELTRLIFKEAV